VAAKWTIVPAGQRSVVIIRARWTSEDGRRIARHGRITTLTRTLIIIHYYTYISARPVYHIPFYNRNDLNHILNTNLQNILVY